MPALTSVRITSIANCHSDAKRVFWSSSAIDRRTEAKWLLANVDTFPSSEGSEKNHILNVDCGYTAVTAVQSSGPSGVWCSGIVNHI